MKILFVCTGNTCRSCMAEAIFNKNCNIEHVEAISAGLSIVSNSFISKHSSDIVLEKLDFNIETREAVKLTEDMVREADLILTMTKKMVDSILCYYSIKENKIFSLNSYVGIEGDIVDPFGGNIAVYEETYKMLNNSINLLLVKLKEDISIS